MHFGPKSDSFCRSRPLPARRFFLLRYHTNCSIFVVVWRVEFSVVLRLLDDMIVVVELFGAFGTCG